MIRGGPRCGSESPWRSVARRSCVRAAKLRSACGTSAIVTARSARNRLSRRGCPALRSRRAVTSPGGVKGRRATDPEFLSRVQFALTASFHFLYPAALDGPRADAGRGRRRVRADQGPEVAPAVVLLDQGLRPDLRPGRRDGHRPGVRVRHELGRLLPVRRQRVRQPAGRGRRVRVRPRGRLPGLLLFGGNRLGPRLWLFATIVVVFGAHFSALWIIMANSWMQTPQGYEIVDRSRPDPRGHDQTSRRSCSRRRSCPDCCTCSWRRGRPARR